MRIMADINKAEAMKAANPADFARAIDVDPKRLRAKLRNLGVRVSDDRAAFNADAKNQLWDHFVTSKKEAPAKTSPAKGKAKQKA